MSPAHTNYANRCWKVFSKKLIIDNSASYNLGCFPQDKLLWFLVPSCRWLTWIVCGFLMLRHLMTLKLPLMTNSLSRNQRP